MPQRGVEPANGVAVVRMGAGFCIVSVGLQLATMRFLPHSASLVHVALAEVGIGIVAALLAVLRPDVALPSRLLLVYPGLICLSVLVAATAGKDVGGAYLGLLTICFIYVGFTQTRSSALWLVPAVAPLWWYCQTTPATESAVRFPISVTIWLIVGEVPAFRTHSTRTQLGRLSDDAATDALTGLGNRRSLDRALNSLQPGDSIVVIDIDNFKAINDTFGHDAGDRALTDFAATVRSVLRSGDLAFRFGGEELVLILRRGPGSPGGAGALLERLRNSWASDGRPTFSAGACVHRGGSPAETMQRADGALYEAKNAGRDGWKIAGTG